MILLCFFKQKTAYEMRISDWSSDVCSSDLAHLADDDTAQPQPQHRTHQLRARRAPGFVRNGVLKQDHPALLPAINCNSALARVVLPVDVPTAVRSILTQRSIAVTAAIAQRQAFSETST